MGVKDASELSSNYINKDSEDKEIIVQAKACIVDKYKKVDRYTNTGGKGWCTKLLHAQHIMSSGTMN